MRYVVWLNLDAGSTFTSFSSTPKIKPDVILEIKPKVEPGVKPDMKAEVKSEAV